MLNIHMKIYLNAVLDSLQCVRYFKHNLLAEMINSSRFKMNKTSL